MTKWCRDLPRYLSSHWVWHIADRESPFFSGKVVHLKAVMMSLWQRRLFMGMCSYELYFMLSKLNVKLTNLEWRMCVVNMFWGHFWNVSLKARVVIEILMSVSHAGLNHYCKNCITSFLLSLWKWHSCWRCAWSSRSWCSWSWADFCITFWKWWRWHGSWRISTTRQHKRVWWFLLISTSIVMIVDNLTVLHLLCV